MASPSPERDVESANHPNPEHLAFKSFEEVRDSHDVDPRLASESPLSRPSNDQLDETVIECVSSALRGKEGHSSVEKDSEPIYIDFEPDDTRDPVNFSRRRKWAITCGACFLTLLSASTASSFSMGTDSMVKDLHTTPFLAALGLSLYALGFGLVPLVSSALSEEFGRNPLYIVCTLGFLLMHVMVGGAKNITTVMIARFLEGAFGSTGSTLAGGTVADIWMPHERGVPMCFFALTAIAGTGLGAVAAGWVEQNPNLQWRWIQWIEVIIIGVYFCTIPFLMKETRRTVMLTRMARKMRKDTGNNRYRARVEDERGSLRNLIVISCTRPFYLLITEPVVSGFSLWIGFAWGIMYSLIESISPIFQTLHGFSIGLTGTVFVTFAIGAALGYLSNIYQERLYARNFSRRGPEARLYSACVAAVMFPTGMFIYAWTSLPGVSWVGLCVGLVIFMWAVFIMYLAVFTYLADCYGPYASSALAGQSLCRNLAATAFPLFTQQMYAKLTYKWSSTLFACLATTMIPIPLLLFFYGPSIRARSKVAKLMMKA